MLVQSIPKSGTNLLKIPIYEIQKSRKCFGLELKMYGFQQSCVPDFKTSADRFLPF